MSAPVIALLTDFTAKSPYAGLLKCVILSAGPKIRIIDITHEIPPQNLEAAAFCAMTSIGYLPEKALLLCVVDPGVGTGRKILWAKTRRHAVICPDNGILGWINKAEKIEKIRIIENSSLFLKNISPVFHGRDIMAPAAAAIIKGLPEKKIGPPAKDYAKMPFPEIKTEKGAKFGKILFIDGFGNAVTNVGKEDLPLNPFFLVGKTRVKGLKEKYADVKPGEKTALIGSSGFLEFSIRNGDFAGRCGVKAGQKFKIKTRL